MARKRAFAYRRCRRGTNCPLLPDAHKCSRVPNLGRHFSCELCDLHAHQTSIGVVRQAAIPVIRTMVGFAGGLVGERRCRAHCRSFGATCEVFQKNIKGARFNRSFSPCRPLPLSCSFVGPAHFIPTYSRFSRWQFPRLSPAPSSAFCCGARSTMPNSAIPCCRCC